MILEFEKANSKGVVEKFYTHSSFIDLQKSSAVVKAYDERKSFTSNFIAALTIGSAWALCNNSVRKLIPSRIPSWGIVGGVFLLGHFSSFMMFAFGVPQMKGIQEAMKASTMPLWRNKNNVTNLDKVFFFLDDDNEQKVNLLHHGLTAERAARMMPDEVYGTIPQSPPVFGSIHHEHH